MSPNPFLSKQEPVCPPHLLNLARQFPPSRTAIANAGFALPMVAAKLSCDAGIMLPVFIGRPGDIEQEAESLSWNIAGYEIINADGEEQSAAISAQMGHDGKVDVVMKGQLHTDTFMGALISRERGIRASDRLVHVFYITEAQSGHPMIISDAALNVSPDIKTRQSAIIAVDRLARATGIKRPKIAILSATETAIASIPSSMDAKTLAEWAKLAVPTSDVSGPLAFDLVISSHAAQIKQMDNDPVAGSADAVIVPDIVSGNTLFKSLVYLGGGCAAGIVLGGKIPVLLTSRADPPAARLASAALASIMRNNCMSGIE